jgi:signal transduction histidine kinase/CheY-like chemotaxis protein
MALKDFKSHFLLENTAYKWTLPISTLLCVVLLLVIESIFQSMAQSQLHCYLEIVPVMILTSLSGYAMGALSVLLFFIIQSLSSHHFVYHAFMLLLASVISNIPIYNHWYKSKKKTLLACVFFSLLLGDGWNIVFSIIEGKPTVFSLKQIHFFSAVPACFFMSAFCYLYFNFFPEKIRSLFFTSSYESEDVKSIQQRLKERTFFGIDERMAMLYLVSVFLLFIAGHTFTYTLVHDLLTNPYQAFVFAMRLSVLMAIFATPIIMLTLSLVNQRITNPIMLMAQAAENSYVCHIGSKNKDSDIMALVDLKTLGIKRKDEIGILYTALVRAFENTNAYIGNLEKEKQLEMQLITAEEANKAKSEFLSNMSHEIRTPINAILGLDEMILRETSDEQTKKYAIDIEHAGKSLLNIVNDILDFSKIEAGKMEIIPTNYHLNSLVNDLVNMISKRAKDKNLALNIDVDKTIPNLLFGDDVRLKQCILNLLTNAVKYTEKGSVTLKVKGEKSGSEHINLTISIIDTGIGLKEEDLPKLFTAFQRIEESRNRTIEGTGLGLNIVQNLLGLMDTKLEVKSVYGEGSTFFFTVKQRVVDWTEVGDFNDLYKKSLLEIAKYKEGFHAPNAKILIVDDTELNLTVAKGLLKQTKIQIDTAKSGQETLELVTKKRYDIIFLDHRMPQMDGIETFHAMKALATNLNHETPCIALTANAIAGAKEMYLEEGFTDYLSKPIESKKLEALIVKYLPESLVEKASGEGESEKQEDLTENQKVKELFDGVTGINLADALKYTGSAEILFQTMREFACAIDQKAADIERFANEKDWRNFTVLVHALKSSARLIGAKKLSEDAAYLEKCGDREDEEEITSKTPALLRDYNAYKEHLSTLCHKVNENKSEISKEDFDSAAQSIKECALAFDFDTIDNIMEMLDSYIIPPCRIEEFTALQRAVRDVDQSKILSILEKK